MKTQQESETLDQLETELFLEAVHRRYGYDFRDYSPGSIRRRIHKRMAAEHLQSVSELQHKVLREPECMTRLLLDASINVTAMFRDPQVYLALRQKVVPLLATYPFVRIWVAGCATGEEVYSLAILLQEEGLYAKCRIYATDFNEAVLGCAKAGIFPLSKMREYTTNYQKAGGTQSFSGYYTANYDNAIMSPDLKENLTFAQHNLVSDKPFNEFNLILCRNVMIYFNRELQEHCLELFHESLCMFGFLGLGVKESLTFSPHEQCYEELPDRVRLYKRIK
jgi:chemotaxis protein methyltransferase CheR